MPSVHYRKDGFGVENWKHGMSVRLERYRQRLAFINILPRKNWKKLKCQYVRWRTFWNFIRKNFRMLTFDELYFFWKKKIESRNHWKIADWKLFSDSLFMKTLFIQQNIRFDVNFSLNYFYIDCNSLLNFRGKKELLFNL